MNDDTRRKSFENVQFHLSCILKARSDSTHRTNVELAQEPVDISKYQTASTVESMPSAWNNNDQAVKKAS